MSLVGLRVVTVFDLLYVESS